MAEEAVFPGTGRRLAVAFHPAQAARAVHRPSLEAKAHQAQPPVRQGQRSDPGNGQRQLRQRPPTGPRPRRVLPPTVPRPRKALRQTVLRPEPRDSKNGPRSRVSAKKARLSEQTPVSRVPPNGPTHASSKPPTGPAVASRPRSPITEQPIQKQAIRLRQAVTRHALSTRCRPLATTITTTGMAAKSRRWPSARPWWVLS